MVIERNDYLERLINKKDNGLIKIITGMRRCGKSYLLNNLYYQYLLDNGVNKNQIIRFSFDIDDDIDLLDKYLPDEPTKVKNKKFKYVVNSKKFRAYIKDLTNDEGKYYLFLDEVQYLEDFVNTLNGYLRYDKFDVYVTGSNSKLLSSDILTEFRGRGDQLRLYPLSFKEYYNFVSKNFDDAYEEYSYYGGIPLVVLAKGEKEKKQRLAELTEETYIKDIIDRYLINDLNNFRALINLLASNIGSYVNPTRLQNIFKTELNTTYDKATIKRHIEYLKDAFILEEALRFDIRGNEYITANSKYFFKDLGIRNSFINYRQQEETHIMENIIYNELILRGYNVDVGLVETYEKNKNNNNVKKSLEVDFVCNRYEERIYIQSCYEMSTTGKTAQETRSLRLIDDSFKKIIIVYDNVKSWITDKGFLVVSLKDFLLNNIL